MPPAVRTAFLLHHAEGGSAITGETRRLQCAGLNRHEVEDERALRERNSDPLGLESCAGYREVHSEA